MVDIDLLVVVGNRSKACQGSVAMRATMGSVVIAEGMAGITPVGFEQPLTLSAEDPLPNSDAIRVLPTPVAIEYSGDGTNWHLCGYVRPSKRYVVPWEGGEPTEGPRFDFGLETVLEYAVGASDPGVIARRLNRGVALDIVYVPGFEKVGHSLSHITLQRAMCQTNSELLLTWGSATSGRIGLYVNPDAEYWVSCRVGAPANDGVGANPRFTFHAVVLSGGTYWDPSYGTSSPVPPVITALSKEYAQVEEFIHCDGSSTIPVQQLQSWFAPYGAYVDCGERAYP